MKPTVTKVIGTAAGVTLLGAGHRLGGAAGSAGCRCSGRSLDPSGGVFADGRVDGFRASGAGRVLVQPDDAHAQFAHSPGVPEGGQRVVPGILRNDRHGAGRLGHFRVRRRGERLHGHARPAGGRRRADHHHGLRLRRQHRGRGGRHQRRGDRRAHGHHHRACAAEGRREHGDAGVRRRLPHGRCLWTT